MIWVFETLIICPKNLEPMWENHRREYGLRGAVLPISQVTQRLPALKHYKLVLIDESHNLRNREGRRYKAIADYIKSSDARVILLTASLKPSRRMKCSGRIPRFAASSMNRRNWLDKSILLLL